MFCMKTIGEQAKEFRESKQWTTIRMGKEVGTSRQNIENLELTGNRKPHYISDLARVMGTTVDALLAGLFTAQSQDQNSNTLKAIAAIAPVATEKVAMNHYSLDVLFNMLPNDPILRATVFHQASAVILDVINGRSTPSAAPSRTDLIEKSHG